MIALAGPRRRGDANGQAKRKAGAMGDSKDVCPKCWHEDCQCGRKIEDRKAAERAEQARKAAERIAKERRSR